LKNIIICLIVLLPNLLCGQGFVDPCGTGLDPFDHSHQVLFDSCFRTQTFIPNKKCTITITDSMFTTGKPETIEVKFDNQGRPVLLSHAMQDAERISCALISCTYRNNEFYSTHIQGSDSARTSVYREIKSPNGRYREDLTWYQSDTTKRPDSRICYYRNIAGRDSCIKTYSTRSGTVIQSLTKVNAVNDSVEERTYMNIQYRWHDSEGDTTYSRRTITFNKRRQVVKREYVSIKTGIKFIWVYKYNNSGRLIGHAYSDSYGKNEAFTIERNNAGLPSVVRCYGTMYRTIYRFNWE
jgi:hypothetical protein